MAADEPARPIEFPNAWTSEEARAHLALEAAGLGAWEIVPNTEESSWSCRAKELLGFDRSEPVTYERFLSTMRPPDRVRCIEAFLRGIEPDGDTVFRVEYRLQASALRWLRLTGTAFLDERPAVRLVGTIEEVTAEKMREARFAELRHDLRTPLHNICIATELLRGASEAEAAELLLRIRSTARRAVRMADRLVGPARDDAALRTEPLSVHELCTEVISEVLLGNPGRSIRLDATTACRGEWDRERLFQMVHNLVCNAVQHGDPGTPVVVSAVENPRRVLITVSNGGEPIPAAVRDRLLERSLAPLGRHGVGFAIVQDVAAAHGGAIDLSSDEAGTVVRVRLPKRQAAAEAARRS
jgi:signal transduction histidine kinase